jgi:hypothetical protein
VDAARLKNNRTGWNKSMEIKGSDFIGVIDMEAHNTLLDYLIIFLVLTLGVILTSVIIRAWFWAPVVLSSVSWNA